MKKLEINLFPKEDKATYEKKKLEFISGYSEYQPGFFGHFKVKRPDVGEIEWRKAYPDGYSDWALEWRHLNAQGQQNVIDKINELVEAVNRMTGSADEQEIKGL